MILSNVYVAWYFYYFIDLLSTKHSKEPICNLIFHSLTYGFVVDLLTLADLSEMEGVDMVDVCEGGGDSSPLLEGDNLRLRASIDCFIWAIRNSMISLSSLNRTPSKYAV